MVLQGWTVGAFPAAAIAGQGDKNPVPHAQMKKARETMASPHALSNADKWNRLPQKAKPRPTFNATADVRLAGSYVASIGETAERP